MSAKVKVSAIQKGGILQAPSGKLSGLVVQKNGIIRSVKVYVKNKRKYVL